MEFAEILSMAFTMFFLAAAIAGGLIYFPANIKSTLKKIHIYSLFTKNTLIDKFPYYRNLSNKQRKEFDSRLGLFLKDKKFIAKDMDGVTEEMRLLIAASAVQLTFGFNPIAFSHFKSIIIYPSKYKSQYSGKLHRGEVSQLGTITLSWEDFSKGYSIPHDGFNVGLHEMAHALKIEAALVDKEHSFLESKDLIDWHRLCVVEMRRIKRGHQKFLRKYASINSEEFFAVCIEQFFEQPYLFKREMPELYQMLTKILKQDPTKFYRSVFE